uniref:Uncharacterized protein n=1 Tax=Lepeophtheirus salmonis TaxID=72036 RepID=A0A0K2UJH5_LEPSM
MLSVKIAFHFVRVHRFGQLIQIPASTIK